MTHVMDGVCNIVDSDRKQYSVTLTGSNSVTIFDLPMKQVIKLGTYVERRGVHVNCSTEINLYGFSRTPTGDKTSAFPVIPIYIPTLSSKYVVDMSVSPDVGVVAVNNNTSVKVKMLTLSTNKTNTIDELLHNGEVLQIYLGHHYNDIDEVHVTITSNKAVAVFSGSLGTDRDACMSQLPPQDRQGQYFIIPNPPSNLYNFIVVSSTYNRTNVTLHDSTSRSIVGADILMDAKPMYSSVNLTSTRPISAIHLIINTVISSMLSTTIPNTEEYGTYYIIPDIQDSHNNYTRYLTVITPTNCTSPMNITTNGATVTLRSRNFSVTAFQPREGLILLNSTMYCPFAVRVIWVGNGTMFGFFARPSPHSGEYNVLLHDK